MRRFAAISFEKLRQFYHGAGRILSLLTIKLVQVLYWFVVQLAKALKWVSIKLAVITYDNYKKRHRSKLRKGENLLRLGISIFILYFISKALLETDWRLGLSFVVAGLTAIWFGYIYRGREVMGLVLIGVIIGSLVTLLAPDAWQAFSSGDFIGLAFIVFLMFFFYYISREYKKGRRPRL